MMPYELRLRRRIYKIIKNDRLFLLKKINLIKILKFVLEDNEILKKQIKELLKNQEV